LINSMNENAEKMTHLRQYLLEKLKETKVDFTLYESELNQVPQIVGMAFSKLQGQYIMLECNKNGLAISTGSACQVGQQSPPRTLLSLGKTRDEANQFVRISFGKTTTVDDLDLLVTVLGKIVHNLSWARVNSGLHVNRKEKQPGDEQRCYRVILVENEVMK